MCKAASPPTAVNYFCIGWYHKITKKFTAERSEKNIPYLDIFLFTDFISRFRRNHSGVNKKNWLYLPIYIYDRAKWNPVLKVPFFWSFRGLNRIFWQKHCIGNSALFFTFLLVLPRIVEKEKKNLPNLTFFSQNMDFLGLFPQHHSIVM